MIFIFAGYETSSSTMCFLAYNLATHPDIQKALQDEIDEAFPDKVTQMYILLSLPSIPPHIILFLSSGFVLTINQSI